MKVKDLLAIAKGTIRFSLNEEETPLCGRDFWAKYRKNYIWEQEIDSVRFIPINDPGMWFHSVTCIITLKQAVP